jgi:hypothetical protein
MPSVAFAATFRSSSSPMRSCAPALAVSLRARISCSPSSSHTSPRSKHAASTARALCSSLYTYCIYELRFSEDEAFRRVAAARLARRFPARRTRRAAPLDGVLAQRGVQFTATEEFVSLVDEAKALLSHAVPKLTIEELQLRAMRAFVADLKKKKYYVGASGRPCAEAHLLEFHHLKPFAASGEHTASNLTLRCRAHNVLAAEEDFGRAFIEHKQASNEHEAFRESTGVSGARLSPGSRAT